MPGSLPPPPTELIFLPRASWVPLFAALGIALVVVGLFAGWIPLVVGALIALAALRRWIAGVREDTSRLPREQRPATAVLPPVPPPSSRA